MFFYNQPARIQILNNIHYIDISVQRWAAAGCWLDNEYIKAGMMQTIAPLIQRERDIILNPINKYK